MRLEVALFKKKGRIGQLIYELKDEEFGTGNAVSIEVDDPRIDRELRAALKGNPNVIFVASHLVREVATTSDGLEHALWQFKQDFGIDFDRDAIPRPSIIRRENLFS